MRHAVEEILRWTTAVTHSMRTALKETEIRRRKINEGDWVVVWNASANRDEEAFANADTFNVARDPNNHLALAHGEQILVLMAADNPRSTEKVVSTKYPYGTYQRQCQAAEYKQTLLEPTRPVLGPHQMSAGLDHRTQVARRYHKKWISRPSTKTCQFG